MAEPHRHQRPFGPTTCLLWLTAAFLLISVTGTASAAPIRTEEPVKDARIFQAGKKLIFEVQTSRQVNLGKLERQPDLGRPRATYLCFELTRNGSKLINRLCLGGKKNSHHRIGITRTNRGDKVYSKDTIAANVERSRKRKLVFSIDAAGARLKPAGYTWRVVSSDGSCRGKERDCRVSFPKRHHSKYRIRPLVITGCTGGVGDFINHGPRGKKRIALTFDDGPSLYTPDFLRVLKAHDVKATFFMLGTEVERYPETARRILAEGHELANHSTRHLVLPSASDIKNASSIIKRVTGFKPCSFRPPTGAVNSSVLAGAKEAGMNTVTWDVDTNDWRLPGSGSIFNSVSHARSGSIVLMHDGGGPRSQTLDALADGIENLRNKGYKLVPVTQLLGNDFKYRPR